MSSHKDVELAPSGSERLLSLAEQAVNMEKTMSLRETVRTYKKAIIWSMIVSTALIMEGYDVVIINSYFGQDAFLARFGVDGPDGTKYVPANWQAAVNNAASIGQVIGLFINGYCQSRFGAKRTYLCAMVGMIAAIFVLVFANSLQMLFAGELVSGIPWGIFQTLTTAYASEICPIRLRGYLTSYVSMCWGIGLSIGAGVVRATLHVQGDWAWRVPYILQWIWPVPLLAAVAFAPESPWWLVRKGREDDARRALQKLTVRGFYTVEKMEAQIAMMNHTIELERREVAGSGFSDCFKGSNLRRTEIACVVWMIQYWCGQPITNFATQFLRSAGMSEDAAFDVNLVLNIMFIVGTMFAWLVTFRYGRRFMYLFGQGVMCLMFLSIGIIGSIPQTSSTSIGIGALMILITFAYSISVGPACYTLVAEIPATTVRAQTIVLARVAYILSQAMWQQLSPRFLTPRPDGWGLGGKAGYVFVGTNIFFFIYCYFRLPETMGRTFGELDLMFAQRLPARKFKTTQLNEFGGHAVNPQNVSTADDKEDVRHHERL